jgi:hypothetical protein
MLALSLITVVRRSHILGLESVFTIAGFVAGDVCFEPLDSFRWEEPHEYLPFYLNKRLETYFLERILCSREVTNKLTNSMEQSPS